MTNHITNTSNPVDFPYASVLKDWDTAEQIDLFYEYLEISAEIEDRQRYNDAFGHSEAEWEAFQYGWNAAKQHFGIKE